MPRERPICIAAPSRWRKALIIPAIPTRNGWMCGGFRPCLPWPMPDREAVASIPFLPYGRQEIGDADVKAVVEALVSGWLTTGPRVSEFEQAFAQHCGARQ